MVLGSLGGVALALALLAGGFYLRHRISPLISDHVQPPPPSALIGESGGVCAYSECLTCVNDDGCGYFGNKTEV